MSGADLPPGREAPAHEPVPEEKKESGGLAGGFIRHPIMTFMLSAGIAIVGVLAYFVLPVAPLPTVDVATMLVTAELAGADPQTNAFAVTNPLEAQFGQIAGLTQMTSSSANSYAEITLSFGFNRTVTGAAGDVQAAISAASPYLPASMAQPPMYRKTNPADVPVLILALTSDTLPLTTVDDYGQNLLTQALSRVKGVGLVTIGGQQQPAMRVNVDPAKLAALGLTIGDARNAIIRATTITSKGVLQGAQKSVALEANDQLVYENQYDDIVIAYHNNAPVLLRDVGHAQIGPANPLLAGWYNGRQAIILNILLTNGANAIETVDLIQKELPRLRAELPNAINLSVVSDRTKTIRASVSDVEKTLLLTIGLVVVTIFIFLRAVWATIIPAIAMVLSLFATAAVMYALGFSLDNLSLMGLSIAIGFVVDDAIVVIENVSRYLEEGLPPFLAALRGAGEISFTVMSISISLCAVFIPLFMMAGVVGKMLQEFAITVAVAVLVSAFISLSLTPTLCSLLLKPEQKGRQHGRLYNLAERGFDALLAGYDRLLRIVLRHQFATLMVMLGTVALTGYLFVVIPKGFFPEQDTGLIEGITEAASDVSVDSMAKLQQAVAAIVLRDHSVASVASYIGPGPSNAAPNQGRMFITLKPLSQRGPDSSAEQVIARLSKPLQQIAGIRLYMQPAQDITIGARTAKAMYQYTLMDADASELASYASRMVEQLKHADGVTGVSSDQESSGPTLMLDIDRKAAAQYNLEPQTIDEALNNAFGNRTATKVFGPFGQYFVIVGADPAVSQGPDALERIYLHAPNGNLVRLSQVAHISTQSGPVVINHQNQLPSVTISFNLKPGYSIGTAVSSVQKIAAAMHLPLSLQASFAGTANAYQTALAGQVPLIGAALIAIYLILGMLYESVSHPITIISTLPAAGLGALLTLMAVGMPLDVIGIIGILLLLGIVKKNGIMLVDFAIGAEREGKSPADAIHEACRKRFRPILMTTICAMLGGVPLILGTGIGSQIRVPLGYTIVGGLAVSQVLTLFTTPIIYIYIDRLAQFLARRKASKRAPERLHGAKT
jgi:hydrophobe/amphiphile efflux-1 (HAE1) family protein